MSNSVYAGIDVRAFTNQLRVVEGPGYVEGEIVREAWYKLSFEAAQRFIEENEFLEYLMGRGEDLADPWIKLITREHRDAATGAMVRTYWSTSLRPYEQGYGCDGTTDLNIHTLANRLAAQHSLDYREVLIRAYPDQFSATTDFSWLEDEVVIAETIIPDMIDPDLALDDLQAINNHTLAIEFGIKLYQCGATSTDWVAIKQQIADMERKMKQDMDTYFAQSGEGALR